MKIFIPILSTSKRVCETKISGVRKNCESALTNQNAWEGEDVSKCGSFYWSKTAEEPLSGTLHIRGQGITFHLESTSPATPHLHNAQPACCGEMTSVCIPIPEELPRPTSLSDFAPLKDATIFLRVSSPHLQTHHRAQCVRGGSARALCCCRELLLLLHYSWCLWQFLGCLRGKKKKQEMRATGALVLLDCNSWMNREESHAAGLPLGSLVECNSRLLTHPEAHR